MPEAQVEFVKRAFIDFSAQRRDGTVDKKLLKLYGIDHPERYITVSALAVRLNIHPKTAEGLLEDGTVPHRELEAAGIRRILIDSQEINLRPLLPGRLAVEELPRTR